MKRAFSKDSRENVRGRQSVLMYSLQTRTHTHTRYSTHIHYCIYTLKHMHTHTNILGICVSNALSWLLLLGISAQQLNILLVAVRLEPMTSHLLGTHSTSVSFSFNFLFRDQFLLSCTLCSPGRSYTCYSLVSPS